MFSPGARVRRDSLDEYGNTNHETMEGQYRCSMLTFIVLPHMYVPDILHETWVTSKLLILGQHEL